MDKIFDFNVYLNTLRQKGNLAYEYNPLYNYQTDVDLYIVEDNYIVPTGQAVNIKNGELLTCKGYNENLKWVDKRGREIDPEDIILAESGELWAKAGSLIDLDTDKLNFDLDHPVEIEVQPSYDGSVNLILNDDKNIPRLINSRFSVREKNTYEIVDRIGENDTNIYNSKTFDKDTSLYFQYEYNPLITYVGFVRGTLPVGQYCFYFTYCDADDNESDFIAESGLIPVFIGNDSDPRSMDGGIKNQLTDKGVQLRLNNLDKSYNYLRVYYVRYFADYEQNRVYECKKIYKRIPINSSILYLQVNGFEETEDLDPNILNIGRFNPQCILTQAQCKNMLFFGNIVKNTDNYKELSDLALRIVPQLNVVDNFDKLDTSYYPKNGDYTYYNSLNIYNKTGYFNQEYYRFGVVFIYQNGTLSNVYNTLGGTLDINIPLGIKQKDGSEDADIYTIDGAMLFRNYIKVDDYGWVKDGDTYQLFGNDLNAKGVCHFDFMGQYKNNTLFSVKFKVPGKVSKYLREEFGIRGLFFVRQKCTPNILAQCYLLGMDEVLEAPVLEEGVGDSKKHYTECFVDKDYGSLTNSFSPRLYEYTYEYSESDNAISKKAYAGLCPDFLLNQPYYNQIFNGGKFRLQKVSILNSHLKRNERFFNQNEDTIYQTVDNLKKVTICTVTDSVETVAIQDKIYRLEIGKGEEAYKFKYAEIDKSTYTQGKDSEKEIKDINKSYNIVRGRYSPYLAIYSESGELETGCLYNIYQDAPISIPQEYLNRMNSSEPFYAISDRYNIFDDDVEYVCWRGDCYINQFTHRLVRNFNDPSLPNNDEIIDYNTWKDNYDAGDSSKWEDISRSDINAVQIGSWITFKVRSAMNYALRSVDHSYVSEEALMGAPRSFYPRSSLLQRGENKMPDSYLYNDAYRASLGFKCYFALQDINYIKDTFSNRIQYSAIAIQDSFKNNYRVSLSTYFRDYSQEYGSIQKLVESNGNLVVIFEHGIGIAPVNERVLSGEGEGGPVYINTQNVLPEELLVLSNTYGTQWGDSVVKSEIGYIYGVDTVAKKIWRIKGQQLEILSDFKVNKFLIDNISLGERELYPIIGLKNVKTHYNNNKKDLIFTFYDDLYKDEEKVWSLCYNELLDQFITFYSWIPSYSENIDTKFFSFDRETAKMLSLLGKCNYSIPENNGVLVDNPVCRMNNGEIDLPYLRYSMPNKSAFITYTVMNSDGTNSEKTISVDGEKDGNTGRYTLANMYFTIEKDHWQHYRLFDFVTDNKGTKLVRKTGVTEEQLDEVFEYHKVILLYITPYLSNISEIVSNTTAVTQFKTEVIAFTKESIVTNPLLTYDEYTRAGLTTDFYLHGQAGIFNVVEDLYPTHWYGKYHPFEFEFVVNDKIGTQKIFTNLVIISNKAEPESFHFEIEGDNYEFSEDKRTMYFRQESTKQLYQTLGSDILYNRYYTDVAANKYTYEQYYRTTNPQKLLKDEDQFKKAYNYNGTDIHENCIGIDKVYPIYSHGLVQQVKSTIFPLYYERIDTYNDIYHKYHLMHDEDGVYDFQNLSGSEISWNRDLNQFNIITHVKNCPIDYVGRLRGNSRYKEGKWNVQIPPISFMQKNEIWDKTTLPTANPFIISCDDNIRSLLCSDDVLVCGDYDSNYVPVKEFKLASCDGEGGSILCEDILTCNDNNLPTPTPEEKEKPYIDALPPIVINSQYLPNDLDTTKVSSDKLPNIYSRFGYNTSAIQVDGWTVRKETKIRDKWIKIRVRYSGKNLAVIHSLITLYNISYS